MKVIVPQEGGSDNKILRAIKLLRRYMSAEGVITTVKFKLRHQTPSMIKHRKHQSVKRRKYPSSYAR